LHQSRTESDHAYAWPRGHGCRQQRVQNVQMSDDNVSCRVAEHHKRRKLEKKEARKSEQAVKNARKRAEFDALPTEEQQARREKAQQAVAARNDAHAAMLARLEAADKAGPRLVVDLDFWQHMTNQERRSMVGQIAFCTSHNKRAEKPCSLHCTRYVGLLAQLCSLSATGEPTAGCFSVGTPLKFGGTSG
jgi:hypothetical protein